MKSLIRLEYILAIEIIIQYHQDCARLARSIAWLHGRSDGGAGFHARMAEKYRALHTAACRRGSAGQSIDAQLVAAVAVRCLGFIAGLSVAAAAVC